MTVDRPLESAARWRASGPSLEVSAAARTFTNPGVLTPHRGTRPRSETDTMRMEARADMNLLIRGVPGGTRTPAADHGRGSDFLRSAHCFPAARPNRRGTTN